MMQRLRSSFVLVALLSSIISVVTEAEIDNTLEAFVELQIGNFSFKVMYGEFGFGCPA